MVPKLRIVEKTYVMEKMKPRKHADNGPFCFNIKLKSIKIHKIHKI